MSYCLEADVLAEFKNLTLNSTNVSSTNVTEWIAQADAYIDGKVGLKYEVPIAAAAALKIVKEIATYLVAARVKRKLDLDGGDSKVIQLTKGDLKKIANEMLQEIIDGKLLLTGATLATSADGVRSFAVDEDEEHTFKKGEDQY